MVNINQTRWHKLAVDSTQEISYSRFRNSSQVFIPSSWGTLVYKEDTSSVTIKVPGGSGGNILSLFMKSVVSQIYDGREVTSGYRKQSTKREMFFVRAPFEGTIGVLGLPGLWILGRR